MFDLDQCINLAMCAEICRAGPHGGTDMANEIDLEGLAREVAEIAGTTTDPDTAERLMELVERLLREAGLRPPDRHQN
jgi:hypothetical protein